MRTPAVMQGRLHYNSPSTHFSTLHPPSPPTKHDSRPILRHRPHTLHSISTLPLSQHTLSAPNCIPGSTTTTTTTTTRCHHRLQHDIPQHDIHQRAGSVLPRGLWQRPRRLELLQRPELQPDGRRAGELGRARPAGAGYGGARCRVAGQGV